MGEDASVSWTLDTTNSRDDSNNCAPIQLIKKIPKYNEPDHIEEAFNKKYKKTLYQKSSKNKISELLKKSLIAPGFEQFPSVPTAAASRRAQRRERKKEREKTKGPGWFNIPIQEITEEVKNDLDLLKMRSILNPRSFYKKNDLSHTPKYFQIGTVIETPADFYSSRIPKAQRKRSLVGELLADEECRAYQKMKYKDTVETFRRKRNKGNVKKNKKK